MPEIGVILVLATRALVAGQNEVVCIRFLNISLRETHTNTNKESVSRTKVERRQSTVTIFLVSEGE